MQTADKPSGAGHRQIIYDDCPVRAGIIRYLSRRDELHINSKNATLGERVPSRRLASRRLNHILRDKKATLQLVAGWELPLYSAATAKH